ncbi:hypothetical protein RvY_14308-2 [Ramazzottius varieornatus]|uniref:lactoylglutathione lyase n=1 Tax=Ramazzottius varieornatus TaxID=947166 RepID=A0A1D1VQW2_RAMVA|nr:hypothetical protein RvY_14308-2 [Ramazzottius varieornatus]
MALSVEDAERCIAPRDPTTQEFLMQQTMLRIKDPKTSLDFYSRVLGMRLLKKLDFEAGKFSLFFMGYEDENEIPKDEKERGEWALSRKATIELTHNWGTEKDESFKYHNGNTEPRGFGNCHEPLLCLFWRLFSRGLSTGSVRVTVCFAVTNTMHSLSLLQDEVPFQ